MSEDKKANRHRHKSVLFPAILIAGGMLLLLGNMGLLPPNFWQNIWRLWPIFLILFGLEIVFRRLTGWGAIGAKIIIGVLVISIGLASVYSSSWANNGSINTGPLRIGNIVTASGKVVTEERHFVDFDEVSIAGNIEVDIVRSDWFSVNVTADDNLMDHFVITQEGKKLEVSMDAIPINSDPAMRVRITMPTLNHLSLNSANHTTIQNFETASDFRASIDGASTLVGNINSDSIDIEVLGASTANLAGSAKTAKITGSGISKLDMSDFTLAKANANISGGSSATVSVSDNLEADVSGGSTLTYSGSPSLDHTKTSGDSTIKHR